MSSDETTVSPQQNPATQSLETPANTPTSGYVRDEAEILRAEAQRYRRALMFCCERADCRNDAPPSTEACAGNLKQIYDRASHELGWSRPNAGEDPEPS